MRTKAELVLDALIHSIEVTIGERTYAMCDRPGGGTPMLGIKAYGFKDGQLDRANVTWLPFDNLDFSGFLALSEQLTEAEAIRLVFALGVSKDLPCWGSLTTAAPSSVPLTIRHFSDTDDFEIAD